MGLEDQARSGSALYVPKIQELEAEVEEVQLELEQALENQQALQQDLAAKTVVIHELLRRSGLTASKGRVRRLISAAVPRLRTSAASASDGISAEQINVPSSGGMAGLIAPGPIRIGELERALERALTELSGLRGGLATADDASTGVTDVR